MAVPLGVVDDPLLRRRVRVFRDRSDAGRRLASLLTRLEGSDALVLAVPAGGTPVAAALASALALPLDLAVVSKITPSWDSEVGYGAVAFDGRVHLDEALVARLHLTDAEVEEGIARTREKVRRRLTDFRGLRPPLAVAGRTVVLVDDGLASGLTLETAVEALKGLHVGHLIVAVPTGHDEAARRLVGPGQEVVCANLRSGKRFVVADAYQSWSEVSEEELHSWASWL